MKLNTIYEGFGIITNHDPDESIVKKPVTYTAFDGDLYYNEIDTPGDIVPLRLGQSSLSTYIAAHEKGSNVPLPNFDGIIYYGFENVRGEYRNQAVNDLLKPLEKVKTFLTKNGMLDYNYPKDIKHNIELNEKEGSQKFADQLRVVAKYMDKWYKYFNYDEKRSITVDKLLNKLNNYIADYAYQAGLAFARRIKKPSNEADARIRDKFIELSIQQLQKMPTTPVAYDYIIAPQSSSDFNKLFASAIAQDTGSELLFVQKHKVKERIVVDKNQIEQYIRSRNDYSRFMRGGQYVVASGDKAKYYDNFEDFVDKWVENEAIKLMKAASNASSIKNIPLDKRRYLKIYSDVAVGLDGHEEHLSATSDKFILLIDDNVAGGATIELLYEIIRRVGNPKRIDIFVPLRLTGA